MGENGISAAWRGTVECRNCSIRDCALFADLRDHDFNLIHASIEKILHKPGSILYEAGQRGQNVFTLRGGLVKLVQCSPDGTERIVRLLRQGTVAGLEVMLDAHYEHTAITPHPPPLVMRAR
jgi:CRP/FNR family transcriptional regulator, anaerobic regulatory protein